MSTHYRLLVDGFAQHDYDDPEAAEAQARKERRWSSVQAAWVEPVEHLEPGTAVLLKPFPWRSEDVRAFEGQTCWVNRHISTDVQLRLPDGTLASLTDNEFERTQ